MSEYVGVPSNNPAKYLGANVNLISIVNAVRPPTGADVRQPTTGKYYPIGSFWILDSDPISGVAGDLYYLSNIVANVAQWSFISNTDGLVSTLTGNSGGAVASTAGNINLVGDGTTITITGDPATSTLTASLVGGGGSGIDSFTPDSGTNPVVPTGAGLVSMAGSGSIETVGGLNSLTTQLTGMTNHSVLVGAGTSTLTKLAVGTDGQVLIGATAADPAFGTLTSSDSSITFTTGAASLGLTVTGGTTVGKTITGDSGGALSPSSGNWNILGTGSFTTVGSGSTITGQLTGLTNHSVLVGAGTATITKVGPSATTGAPLISAGAAADPTFATTFIVNDAASFAEESDTLAGGAVQLGVENLDTVGPGSAARITITANGAGDAYALYDLDVAGNNYEMGARQSDAHFILTREANTSLANIDGTVIVDYNPTADASATPSTPSYSINAPIVLLDRDAPGQQLVLGAWQEDDVNTASSAKVESRVVGPIGSINGDAWMSTVGNLDWSWGEDATTPASPVFRFGHGGSPRNLAQRFYSITDNGVITFGDSLSAGNFYSFPTSDGTIGQTLVTNGAGVLSFASNSSLITYTTVAMTPYIVTADDEFLSVDSSTAKTIQLPNSTTTGRLFVIKDRTGSAATNNITVTTVGGVVTIDGATSYLMTNNYGSIELLFNGSSYEVF